MSKNSDKPAVFSALEVANICGVVNQTAINWIRNDYLKAFKTPGGQFRVYPDDLAAFMTNRSMRIPQSLLDVCTSTNFASNSILIVDDDSGLNTVIAKYIERKFDGLQIYQAFDGFDAGAQMAEKRPRIVILDLDLPGVDGFDLCRRINEGTSFGKPAIIVITALEDSDAEIRVKQLGAKNFFKKPLNLVDIAAAVANSL
jgi:two-component system, OmpR family, response regulator